MVAGVVVLLVAGSLAGQAEGSRRSRRFEFAETHMGSEFKIVLYSPDEATARRASRVGLRPDRRPGRAR